MCGLVFVACRGNVRSEARYIVSFEPSITQGTGFATSLSLIAKMGEQGCWAAELWHAVSKKLVAGFAYV